MQEGAFAGSSNPVHNSRLGHFDRGLLCTCGIVCFGGHTELGFHLADSLVHTVHDNESHCNNGKHSYRGEGLDQAALLSEFGAACRDECRSDSAQHQVFSRLEAYGVFSFHVKPITLDTSSSNERHPIFPL